MEVIMNFERGSISKYFSPPKRGILKRMAVIPLVFSS